MGTFGYAMFKLCRKCGEEKPLEKFSKDRRSKDGLQAYCKKCNATYKEKNKDKINEYLKKYYQDNLEEMVKSHKEYKESHRDILRKQAREYYRNNIDKAKLYRVKNQKIINIKSRKSKQKYKKTENGKLHVNNSCQKRRSLKNKLNSTLTIEQWIYIKNEFNNKCCYCGKDCIPTQDHFIPISKEGEYSIKNIVPCCSNCNSSKQDKDFLDWYLNQTFYNKERETQILNFIIYGSVVGEKVDELSEFVKE